MLGVLCTGLKESAMLVCAANLPRSCSVSGTATRPTYSEATNASSGLNICDGDSAMIMDQLKAFKAENTFSVRMPLFFLRIFNKMFPCLVVRRPQSRLPLLGRQGCVNPWDEKSSFARFFSYLSIILTAKAVSVCPSVSKCDNSVTSFVFLT